MSERSEIEEAQGPHVQNVQGCDSALGQKVWVTVVTSLDYLVGVLTLAHSLRKVGSKYPLLVLYTPSFPSQGRAQLAERGMSMLEVPFLQPSSCESLSAADRANPSWTKLTAFGLTQFERAVQLDSDMLVLRNMDELMDLELDRSNVQGQHVFAASHACVCNPAQKKHYPPDWIPENCVYNSDAMSWDEAQMTSTPAIAGLGLINAGLLVINPSQEIFRLISLVLLDGQICSTFAFHDQSLLSSLFRGRWRSLPYIYNALRPMSWPGVHQDIWQIEQVKCIHYILSPKPWNLKEAEVVQEADQLWWQANAERLKAEA